MGGRMGQIWFEPDSTHAHAHAHARAHAHAHAHAHADVHVPRARIQSPPRAHASMAALKQATFGSTGGSIVGRGALGVE